MICSR